MCRWHNLSTKTYLIILISSVFQDVLSRISTECNKYCKMLCLCCLSSDLADQKRIDDEIEKELKNWGREFKRERKLLLLGEFI